MSTSLFFARCPPTVPFEDLHSLFKQFGPVKHLNLYRRWATAKTSKGCCIVEFETQEAAAAAMEALNGKHTFAGYPSCDAPMVLEPMDPNRMTNTAAAAGERQKRTAAARHGPIELHGSFCGTLSTHPQYPSWGMRTQPLH